MHFLTTRIKSFKNNFLRLEWLKTCFDAFPGHRNQVLKKTFFLTSEVVENMFLCICAYFQTTRIKSLKIFFLTSGVVQNMFLCICAYFQTTWCHWKIIFFTSGGVKNVFWCISWPPESSPSKIIFSRLGWLKTCFYAFSHISRPPESSN